MVQMEKDHRDLRTCPSDSRCRQTSRGVACRLLLSFCAMRSGSMSTTFIALPHLSARKLYSGLHLLVAGMLLGAGVAYPCFHGFLLFVAERRPAADVLSSPITGSGVDRALDNRFLFSGCWRRFPGAGRAGGDTCNVVAFVAFHDTTGRPYVLSMALFCLPPATPPEKNGHQRRRFAGMPHVFG